MGSRVNSKMYVIQAKNSSLKSSIVNIFLICQTIAELNSKLL